MQITFLVGNGFDISCGIHSSYSCFYKWYCKQEKSTKDHINVFRDTIDKDIASGKKHWADFEAALGQYTSNFTKDTAQQFVDCYRDAHERLMEYLERETQRFSDNIDSEEIAKMRKGLDKFYGELSPREIQLFDAMFQADIGSDTTIRFISFNYTNTLDRCIADVSKEPLRIWTDTVNRKHRFIVNPSIIHVHGMLNRYPTFGVNDESQIANKDLLSYPNFAQVIIKPKCIDALGELWHAESEKVIKSSNIICIFGMSMGITDTKWFESIMDWLLEKGDRHLIIYWHTDTPSNGISPWATLENRREAITKITDFSSLTGAAIDEISKRIHIIENTKKVLQVKLKSV